MKSRYRTKIVSAAQTGCVPEGTLPCYFYTITDGLDGPVIKSGSSCSIKGWAGAWGAAQKTIKRLMLKEKPITVTAINERIHFRLIYMECCGHLLCWVNPRFPTHCPECGRLIYPQIRGWVTTEDPNAHLRFKGTK